jgi:Ca-activated chloride channel homolog
MKQLLFLLLATGLLGDVSKIARTNQVKREAEEAFMQQNYDRSAQLYTTLIDEMGDNNQHAILNLGHSYFRMGNTNRASSSYFRLIASPDTAIKSVAFQQMGVIAYQGQDLQQALSHFKDALRANPKNDDARYNYELVKKLLKDQPIKPDNKDSKGEKDKEEDKKEQEQNKGDQQKNEEGKPKDQDQQQGKEGEDDSQKGDKDKEKEQQAQPREEKEGKQGEEEQKNARQEAQNGQKEPMNSRKNEINKQALEEMNLTEEKARMLLDAMRNSEIQYIQQKQHKGKTRPDRSKPDW